MMIKQKFVLLLLALCTIVPLSIYSWGFFAHKLANKMAVSTLPNGIIAFYKKHIDYITEHAVDPDKRRGFIAEEGARHYIDIDHYGAHPFDSVPRRWRDAVNKFTQDTLMSYGIVPWHIEKMVNRLTEAFRKGDVNYILKCSADLGHYIADAHVPLHTTENYNGQMTNQKGIHGFWESRIPELFSTDYDYLVGKAKYIDSPIDMAWETVKASHAAVDSVLKFEAQLNDRFSADRKYAVEQRSGANVKTYSEEYTTAYNKMLNGQVERRLKQTIIDIGSLWFTAWTNAGMPNLERLDTKQFNDSLKKTDEDLDYLWSTGEPKIKEKGHED
jgi:hypothetical protein